MPLGWYHEANGGVTMLKVVPLYTLCHPSTSMKNEGIMPSILHGFTLYRATVGS